jgi:hypothetical protein
MWIMRGHPRKGKSRGISWILIPILNFPVRRLIRRRRFQCYSSHRCRVDTLWDTDSCVVAILLPSCCVFVRGESDVRSMLCYIVNVTVCVIIETILQGGRAGSRRILFRQACSRGIWFWLTCSSSKYFREGVIFPCLCLFLCLSFEISNLTKGAPVGPMHNVRTVPVYGRQYIFLQSI